MFVSRTALRLAAMGAGLMNDARYVALFDAGLFRLLSAISHEPGVNGLALRPAHRPSLDLPDDPHDRLHRIVFAKKFLGRDRDRSARNFELNFLTASKSGPPADGFRYNDPGVVMDFVMLITTTDRVAFSVRGFPRLVKRSLSSFVFPAVAPIPVVHHLARTRLPEGG